MTLIGFLALWLYIGAFFAVMQIVETILDKIMGRMDYGWKDGILYIIYAVLLWPLALLAGIMNLFFPRAFDRLGNWLKKRTQFWKSPEYVTKPFDASRLQLELNDYSQETWRTGHYDYDDHLDVYVYRHRKTGQLRLARNFSTNTGKWEYFERWQTSTGFNKTFHSEKRHAA